MKVSIIFLLLAVSTSTVLSKPLLGGAISKVTDTVTGTVIGALDKITGLIKPGSSGVDTAPDDTSDDASSVDSTATATIPDVTIFGVDTASNDTSDDASSVDSTAAATTSDVTTSDNTTSEDTASDVTYNDTTTDDDETAE